MLFFRVNSCISVVLSDDAWVLKIEPRAFRGEVHTAARVTGPAVEPLVPKVVRVSVACVLNAVVTFSVHPV